MLNYLHYEFDAGPEDVLEVTLKGGANVLLLDEENFEKYKAGYQHKATQGGWAKVSPVHFVPPHVGHWHVVIDRGGYAGRVAASVRQLANT